MFEKVGIVGAGTMGAGIMINCVTHGVEVVLCDRSEETLQRAEQKLEKYLKRQVEKERITAEGANAIKTLLRTSSDVSRLPDCELVIEAVFEDLDLKRRIFAELEALVSESAVLATNTSCLRLADIGENIAKPNRFCGMHYFSPAEINPVVELIRCEDTSDATFSAVSNFLKGTKKQEIPCRDNNGFALNRFFCPYTNEAVRLLDEGVATVGQLDEIAKDCFGLALGPFAVMNIVGLPTSMKAQGSLGDLGPFYALAEGLVASGAENKPWDIEETVEAPSAEVVKAASDRLIGAVLLPVLELLYEGTATSSAVDTGAEMAFRFVRTPGKLLNELGDEEVQRLLSLVAEPHGHSIPKLEVATA